MFAEDARWRCVTDWYLDEGELLVGKAVYCTFRGATEVAEESFTSHRAPLTEAQAIQPAT